MDLIEKFNPLEEEKYSTMISPMVVMEDLEEEKDSHHIMKD